MASYDFIECSASAYKYIWHERLYVARLALIPVLVKFCCYVTVFGLGLEEAYLRQGLIILPSFFVEGLFVARVVQHAVRQGIPGGSARQQDMTFTPRHVMAAAVLYTLIKLTTSFAGGLAMSEVSIQEPGVYEPSTLLVFAAMAFLAFMMWGVRLLWLYVPVALGYGMMAFLKRIQGISVSFQMIGMWLICFMPLAMVLVVTAGILGGLFGHSEDTPSQIYRFLIVGLQSVMDSAAAALASVAMACGVMEIMRTDKKPGRQS